MLNFGALWPKIIEEDNVIGRKIIILVALLGLRAFRERMLCGRAMGSVPWGQTPWRALRS